MICYEIIERDTGRLALGRSLHTADAAQRRIKATRRVAPRLHLEPRPVEVTGTMYEVVSAETGHSIFDYTFPDIDAALDRIKVCKSHDPELRLLPRRVDIID